MRPKLPHARAWRCPRCGYSLEGLVSHGRAHCPECARTTDEREQAAIASPRAMPRELRRIAQAGMVFTLLVLGWTVVGTLQHWRDGGWGGAHLVLALAAAPWLALSAWTARVLPAAHSRHEVLAWTAAHATWALPLVAVWVLRWADGG